MEAALLQPVDQDEPNVIKVRFNNKIYGSWQAARDAFNQLKTKKGSNSVWSKLTLVPDDKDDDDSPFKLRCFSCGNSCQLGNPSKWNKEHVCKGPPNSTAGTSRAPPHSNQTTLQQFMMNPDQCHEFCKLIVKGMVTGCVPFAFAGNTFIQQALAMIGVSLSAKDVAGRFLDEICAEQTGFDRAMLTSMNFVCGATDGWRKKSCLSGAGLMNFCVMGNQGAYLYDVKDCTDLRKNAEGIANLLEEMAVGIMGGEDDAHRFAGWVMDNTRANVAAMSILEERRPEWVSVGCTGHCAALAMKDFCKFFKTSGRYSSSWGVEWLDTTNRDANTAANYLNDSGCAKAIVHRHQQEIYGAKKAIAVSVPTRFGTNQFVMQGLEHSKAALKQAASDPKWDKLDGKAKKVGELFSSCTFWDNLRRATAFLQPFNDYIHQIEADRPALARVYQGLVQLDRHVRSSLQQWEAADPELAECDNQRTFD
jgi:hypothetical protein